MVIGYTILRSLGSICISSEHTNSLKEYLEEHLHSIHCCLINADISMFVTLCICIQMLYINDNSNSYTVMWVSIYKHIYNYILIRIHTHTRINPPTLFPIYTSHIQSFIQPFAHQHIYHTYMYTCTHKHLHIHYAYFKKLWIYRWLLYIKSNWNSV